MSSFHKKGVTMRKRMILSLIPIILSVVGMSSLLTLPGCSSNNNKDNALFTTDIPYEVAYGNQIYKITDEIVARETLGAITEQLPTAIDRYIGLVSESPGRVGYFRAYSIRGIDENEAISVKVTMAGTTRGYYFYIKYIRQ
jgi:hypothetical protein